MKYVRKYLLAFLFFMLVIADTTGVLAANDSTAISMKLEKTTGTVGISTSSGKPVSLIQKMHLYNGYRVRTQQRSYAWIGLDNTKLVKLDASSMASVRKTRRNHLEVLLDRGNIFFNVAKPLESNESLTIRTSTTAIGIRGTCGWIGVKNENTVIVTILEGSVSVTVSDPVTGQTKIAQISEGETAACVVYSEESTEEKCDVVLEECTKENVDGFVLEEIVQDSSLAEKIFEKSGIDLREVTESEAANRLQADEDETRKKQEAVEKVAKEQESKVAVQPVWTGGGTPGSSSGSGSSSSGSSGSGSSSSGSTSPSYSSGSNTKPSGGSSGSGGSSSGSSGSGSNYLPATATVPEIMAALAKYDTVYVGDGTTPINLRDVPLRVAEGKTLNLKGPVTAGAGSGIAANGMVTISGNLANSGSITVDGTLNVEKDLVNDGNISVRSANTLYVAGNLTNRSSDSGSLIITSTGRVLVKKEFSGGLWPQRGAKIQVESYGTNTAEMLSQKWRFRPSGGENTSGGGYTLVYQIFVTYHANAKSWTDGMQKGTIDEDGNSPLLPLYLSYAMDFTAGNGLRATGWFTKDGQRIIEAKIEEGMDVYAHWSGWGYDADTDTLVAAGEAVEMSYSEQEQSRPWNAYKDSMKTAIIEDGTGGIGQRAFSGCSGLTGIDIPAGVTQIGSSAFYGCSNLTGIDIPAGVTQIGDWAFANCSGLTSIKIPDGITGIGLGTFENCSSLTDMELPTSVTGIADDAFLDCSSLTSIKIPDGVTSIGNHAFGRCTGLTDINIPDGVTVINDRTFSGCISLTNIEIPAGVTSIGYLAFNECSSLTGIDIPASVTGIGMYAFSQTPWLESQRSGPNGPLVIINHLLADAQTASGNIVIPDNVTGISNGAFQNSSLTGVVIPDSVTSIGEDAFLNCSGLTSIAIPNSVTSIGRRAFSGTPWLESQRSGPNGPLVIINHLLVDAQTASGNIVIPDDVTGISEWAFLDSSVTGVKIPASVTSISDNAFYKCGSLTSIVIPNSVTSIGNNAFDSCSNLTSIEIPAGVTGIGSHVFIGCSSLRDVYYLGTEQQWAGITIGIGNGNLENLTNTSKIHYETPLPTS